MDYLATYPDAYIRYHNIDMQLHKIQMQDISSFRKHSLESQVFITYQTHHTQVTDF